MNFNEHQIRLWESMNTLVDDYLENKITFDYLVPSLEGILDSIEIKDKDIVKEWYDVWTPLEIINAEKDTNISNQDKEKVAKEMKKYLLRKLEEIKMH